MPEYERHLIVNPVQRLVRCIVFVQFKVLFGHKDVFKKRVVAHMVVVPVRIDDRNGEICYLPDSFIQPAKTEAGIDQQGPFISNQQIHAGIGRTILEIVGRIIDLRHFGQLSRLWNIGIHDERHHKKQHHAQNDGQHFFLGHEKSPFRNIEFIPPWLTTFRAADTIVSSVC